MAELRDAIAELVTRHPTLRTSFDLSRFEQPLQLVHKHAKIHVALDDFSKFDEPTSGAMIENWLEREKAHRYRWTDPGLIRFHVHTRSEGTYQFTVSFHHSILDGWSVAVMLTELFQLYRNRYRPQEPLPVAPAPSAGLPELVALETQALRSATARRYWLDSLDGIPATRLPRELPSSNKFVLRSREVTLSLDLSEQLVALAQSLNVSLKSVLLAAHARVISVATGEKTIVTGLVGDSRPESMDSDRMLGMFLNNLPLVVDLDAKTWADLIGDIHRKEQASREHRWFPMAELQRINGAPLFEIAFNFVHFHAYEALRDLGEIEYLKGEFSQQTDATLLVSFARDISSSGLRLSLDYNSSEINVQQIDALAQRYDLALRQIATASSAPLHLQTLLTSAEQALIAETNLTAKNSTFLPIDKAFDNWAERTPDAIALIVGSDRLSYSALNRRANQLANLLRANGVESEMRVAVCLERSIDLVVALLGVLKAGGAYVPLDSAHPKARLAYVLEDSCPVVLISSQQLIDRLPDHKLRTIHMDALAAKSDAPTADAILVRECAGAEQLAYVIYTSGSTGRPKGVMISHGALSNFLNAMRARPGIEPRDILLSVTTIAFDIAALELFLPLTSGACVVLAEHRTAADAALLANAIADSGATMMQATPVTWRMLTANGWRGSPSLRILCGGEAFPVELVDSLLRRSAAVWNLYGPTETTIWSAAQRVTDAGDPISIGTPIVDTQLFVLDPWLQQLPANAIGELYIGGGGLARGYYRRPRLTAECFLPNPFDSTPGARMYRTGDLAKRLKNGSIQILGRIDFQVKIRGFRIEPGEIESVLVHYPGIRHAIVGTPSGASTEQLLVAGIVVENAESIDAAPIKEFLAARLPDYMIPARFIRLDALPTQPNGKVDRKSALALLNSNAQQLSRAPFVPPATAAEKLVAAIWEQVLGTSPVGLHDDFFDLGGHSLNAVQVIARLRDVFRVELPLAQLFINPTLEAVVASIANHWNSAEIVEEIAQTALQIENMSDEDAATLLSQQPVLENEDAE